MFTTTDLVGRWVSEQIEPIQNADGSVIYGRRDFTLGDRDWQLRFTAYGDDQATVPLFTLRAEGTYALGDPSPDVADARYADFHFASRSLTAHQPGLVDLFTSASATPWEIDVERDVSADGCAFVPSVSASPTEYDLVKLEGSRLFFGDRSRDLSDPANRPQRLMDDPLVQQQSSPR
jgi:hypothetical protein